MNGRAIGFVLLSSLIMVAAIVLQNTLTPPPPNDPAATQVADPNLPAGTTEATAESADPANLLAEPNSDRAREKKELQNPVAPNVDDTASLAAGVDTSGANHEPELPANPGVDELAPSLPRNAEDKFITIGSLGTDSSDRYLITVNQRGGTIHRIELNFHQSASTRPKYRDLENNGGYLGCLDCLDTPAGCLVRTVGSGTPAHGASAIGVTGGISVGDLLVALDGEPIVSAHEFELRLEKKTKPRTTVQLSVDRGGVPHTFDVALIDKPIELLRPEISRLDPNFIYPESFVLSLLKPLSFVDQVWPDLDREMRTGSWTTTVTNNRDVELSFDLSADELTKQGLVGPLSVKKRYRLPNLAAEEIHNLNSRTFHFNLDVEIVNGADQAQKLAFELDGPTGSTTETWWYAQKIHGRSTAIGYVAGARDIIGSTERLPFVFIGCPEITKGATKSPPVINFVSSPLIDKQTDRNLNYVGVDAQYFNVTLIPQMPENEKFTVDSVSTFTNGGEIPKKDIKLHRLADCTFQLIKSVEIPAGDSYRQSFEIFSGPKEGQLLKHYGLDDTRTFGWFAWCSKPLMMLLHFFYWITGSFSYGLAIIMLTVLVRCCMIPISRKAALNAQMMQHLQPQIKEITDKYKDDMEKRGVAQRELFKRYNYNPLNGCFMMFFQLPIFIGLYRGLSVDIGLRDQPLVSGMSWCSNLSGPDQLLNWKDWMPTMLGDETGWLGPYLNILPLVTMVLFLVQQKMFMPPPTDDQQKMMQKMMTFMMIFMGVMFFKVSAGLCIYFITSSLWGIIERKMLPKPVLDTAKLSVGGVSGALTVDATSRPSKSDLKAEQQRELDLAERKQRNAERKKRLKDRGV